jgi:hypothetical protein
VFSPVIKVFVFIIRGELAQLRNYISLWSIGG